MRTADRVHELFLNYACGAKCAFCYNPPITPELLRRELSFEQAAESLYSGGRSGAKRLNLHGGEVTLRDDLPRLLRLARKVGFEQVTVVTNGLRLSDASYARLLTRAGATHFRLSIHSARPDVHDEILAIPGGFAKASAALDHVRACGAAVGLNYVLHRRNLGELSGFLEEFCLRRGVDDVIVYFPHLRGMAAVNADAVALRYSEAAPSVRAGAAALQAAGRLDSLLLANFVPCALPELASRMLDWAHQPDGAALMAHPEGGLTDVGRTKDEQRGPVDACAACAVSSRCLGVEREYSARWGSAGFAPLAADPEASAA